MQGREPPTTASGSGHGERVPPRSQSGSNRPPARTFGGYALEVELGRGAMGIVYRARGPDGQSVALKVLTSQRASAQRRFQTEASALRRLDHPHLVRVLDAGEDAGRPFLVLELVDGDSLQSRLSATGPFPPREAATIVRDVARALEHAHEQGVLHRDVKPANILLDRAGRPRLSDFGLARELDASVTRVTVEGALLGTPGYLPPEQVRGDLAGIDGRADVYALGATLHALLTGDAPFAGESLGEMLDDTLRRRPTPASAVRPEVDPSLDAVMLRCLEKEPGQRYDGAAGLAEDLDRWLLGRRPLAAGGGLRVPRGVLRPVALLLLLLLVVGVGLSRALDRPRRIERDRLVGESEGWYALREYSRALAAADRALALEREHVPALIARLRALPLVPGDQQPLEAAVKQLLALAPNDPDALVAATQSSVLGSDRDAWIARGLGLDPANARLLVARAWQLQQGDPEGAMADLVRAAELAPGDPDVQFALAIQLGRNRIPEAIETLTRALVADPTRGDLYEQRGGYRARVGDMEGACADWERSAWLGFQRGLWWLCEQALGQRPKLLPRAEALVERYLAVKDEPTLRTYKGQLLEKRGDPAGAEAEWTAALRLDPGHLKAVSLRALLYYRQERFELAALDFGLAWEKGQDPVCLANRGAAWLQLGRFAEAETDLTRAVELEPRHLLARRHLGDTLYQLGRPEEALLSYRRALELAPSDLRATQGRAAALVALGRHAEALDALRALEARLPPGDPGRAELEESIRAVESRR